MQSCTGITLHRTLYVDYVKYTQYEVLRQTLENCTGTDMFYCVYVAMMHPSGIDAHTGLWGNNTFPVRLARTLIQQINCNTYRYCTTTDFCLLFFFK